MRFRPSVCPAGGGDPPTSPGALAHGVPPLLACTLRQRRVEGRDPNRRAARHVDGAGTSRAPARSDLVRSHHYRALPLSRPQRAASSCRTVASNRPCAISMNAQAARSSRTSSNTSSNRRRRLPRARARAGLVDASVASSRLGVDAVPGFRLRCRAHRGSVRCLGGRGASPAPFRRLEVDSRQSYVLIPLQQPSLVKRLNRVARRHSARSHRESGRRCGQERKARASGWLGFHRDPQGVAARRHWKRSPPLPEAADSQGRPTVRRPKEGSDGTGPGPPRAPGHWMNLRVFAGTCRQRR